MNKPDLTDKNVIDDLANRIEQLVLSARSEAAKVINVAEVITKYKIGHTIVDVIQKGSERAEYGKNILKNVASVLTERLGKGWTVESLTLCRKFYMIYRKEIVNSVYEIDNPSRNIPNFKISWSHYLVLMRIENPDERSFYEIESKKGNWSVRQLQRQYNSSLYERLALSRNKSEVIRLANEGQSVEKPMDILKNPVTLEFLGLKQDESFCETQLESAIISKLQTFLLEMGKGFLFEARQKRFTFDEDNYFVDLVFYNRLLQCYVLIDLKIDKLTHQDLGQMQMYVNYYDRYVKQDFEHPTIGILLCRDKKETMVELTLPKNANIFAQQYALYLPDKKLLQDKLKEWIDEQE